MLIFKQIRFECLQSVFIYRKVKSFFQFDVGEIASQAITILVINSKPGI